MSASSVPNLGAPTCTHFHPKLYHEKFIRMPTNPTIHHAINILQLPPAVADHMATLFIKHKFTPQHLPFITAKDLKIILCPPFPTPPLQCRCDPFQLICDAFATIHSEPTLPQSIPASIRQQVITCVDSLTIAAQMNVATVNDVHQRIALQLNFRTMLFSILPQQLSVNVTLPKSHHNLVTSFDLDRVVEDLYYCYSNWLIEAEEAAKKAEHDAALESLGIEIPTNSVPQPPTEQPAAAPAPAPTITGPQRQAPSKPGASDDSKHIPSSTPLGLNVNVSHSTQRRPAIVSPPPSLGPPTSASTSSRPSSSSGTATKLRPSKYHTMNFRKETNVVLTKLDAYGNHTPVYNPDGDSDSSSGVSSPQARNVSNAMFSSSPLSVDNPIAPQSQSQSKPTHLSRIGSTQPALSIRCGTPDSKENNSGQTQGKDANGTVSGIAGQPISLTDPKSVAGTSSNNSTIAPPALPPQVTIQPGLSPLHSPVNSSAVSVDSFSLYTPRARAGTNPNLSQLADRFAIGNSNLWVPYMKKTTQQLVDWLMSWDFSLFNDIPEQHRSEILLRLAVFMFVDCGVVKAFDIPLSKLTHFLSHVSTLYRDNPYHNYLHAWTTLHYTYLLIKHTSANNRIEYSPLVLYAMLLSAICHDIDHPGNNNAFEVQTMSKLALLHNDQSVLENHHCFVTFSLLTQPEFNILANLTKSQLKEIRGLIVTIILNTDMALHNDLTDHFGKASEELLATHSDRTSQLAVRTSANFALIARVIVHCADISGQALHLKSAFLWAQRLRDEFANQADLEGRLGLPVTGFMKAQDDATFAQSQLGFIRGVLRPLWVRMSITFPSTKPSLQHIGDNENFWSSYVEAATSSASADTKGRTFSIASTLTTSTPVKTGSTRKGKPYTLEEHYIRFLQSKDLAQVPE